MLRQTAPPPTTTTTQTTTTTYTALRPDGFAAGKKEEEGTKTKPK